MQLTKKDIAVARRLANSCDTGNIPVKEIRNFLQRIGQSESARSEAGKQTGRKKALINHFKSQIN